MAVAPSHRGRGLAAELLDRGRRPGARAARAAHRARAPSSPRRRVYERAGYAPYGDVFLDAGIEHVMMGKALE